jgi:hypothetical protein
VTLTLKIYDSSGVLVRTLSIGTTGAALHSFTWAPQPYNPTAGPLLLSEGSWSYDYDGKDGNGSYLLNGVYLFVIVSQQGSSTVTVQTEITVIGSTGLGLQLTAAPNPVRASTNQVFIQWQPAAQSADLRIYDLVGGQVRAFGTVSSPAVWDLRTAGGAPVADGVYVISARVPGQKKPAFFKFAVIR